jgi:hypothetical protein
MKSGRLQWDWGVTKGKGKVMPLQSYGAQRVLGRLRLPDSVTSALEGGRLSAIRTGRLYPLILRGWVEPGHMELSDATEKNPQWHHRGSIPGLVAQCLNRYATPDPTEVWLGWGKQRVHADYRLGNILYAGHLDGQVWIWEDEVLKGVTETGCEVGSGKSLTGSCQVAACFWY